MTPGLINAYALAITGLVKAGEIAIMGIEVAAKAIAGIFGRTLSPAELDAIIVQVKSDATLGAQLAALDVGGGPTTTSVKAG
jgi:hypothetical protein